MDRLLVNEIQRNEDVSITCFMLLAWIDLIHTTVFAPISIHYYLIPQNGKDPVIPVLIGVTRGIMLLLLIGWWVSKDRRKTIEKLIWAFFPLIQIKNVVFFAADFFLETEP